MQSAFSNSENSAEIPEIEWNWEQANYFEDWHEPIFELMSRYVPKGAKTLEIGAGGSHTLGALAGRLGCDAFGLEPDLAGIEKTIELAAGESAHVSMVRGDGFYLPFADGQFDVVYSLGLVEHFDHDGTVSLIAEHVRVCRNGGSVVVAVPNALNLPHSLRKAYLGRKYKYFPERSFTPRRLRKILNSAGLGAIMTDGLAPLWGLGMSPLGWWCVRILRRLGIARLLDGIRIPSLRANIGFMSYGIGKKPDP
jgi:SAM-dependent methyltransferase